MPAAKEKWEQDYEEYRDTIIALGGTIKKESALRSAYKIYREKMPARIYEGCVDESTAQTKPQPVQVQPKPQATAPTKNEEKKEPVKEKQPETKNIPAEGHGNLNPHDNKERNEGKPRLTQKERFENYKSNLTRKGIVVNNEAGLFDLFKSIRGRLDYSQIGEFVTFPERKPRDQNNNRNNDRKPRDNNDNRNNNDRDTKPNHKASNNTPTKTRFDEYRESLQAQGYEIIDQNQLARLYNKQKGFISPEQLKDLVRKAPENKRVITNATVSNANIPVPPDNKLPVIIEGSFADKWIKPLQKWCDTDRDKDGKAKRTLTAVKADNNSVVIDIVPSESYAKENKDDAGAQYSFTKKGNNGNIESTLGSKDSTPLDYEYFRQLMKSYRQNNIQAIAFKDIQTDEFRDKLLAAALEFEMKLIGAPEKVDVNASYLNKLPAAVKIKIGVYNGDISAQRNSAEDIKNNIKERKSKTSTKEANTPKQALGLPILVSSREMD